mmetsp:Transcript_7139/g.15582  ORF Transcript_7139/g.15582 Transcript_7139/m.15582 type:complete len:148 (-) Transcript_7139:300-743(-)
MKNVTFVVAIVSTLLAAASGFTVPGRRSRSASSLSMAMTDAPPAAVTTAAPAFSVTSGSLLNSGVNNYLSSSSNVIAEESSDDVVARIAAKSQAANEAARVKAEKSKKTAEQIADEKKTFAWYLWGGGFVAPFLATFYYFGFKFWEK